MTVSRNNEAMSRRYRRHSVHEPVGSDPSREICDMELMRELILGVFLGESGIVFHTDPENDHRYKVTDGLKIDPPTKTLALRLSNIGWLYNRIKRYRNHLSQNPGYGSVAIAFAAALDEAMIEYNRLITTIGQELHDMNDPDYVHGSRSSQRGGSIQGMPFVSLSRIEVWTFDWYYKLKMLAVLIEKCKHKRGGALINVIYKESMHGDPMIRECMVRILVKVVEELKKMLSRWIFHGQIDDPYKEFFIMNTSQSQLATCSTGYSTPTTSGRSTIGQSLSSHSLTPLTGDASTWLEKHTINHDMLPGFIPQDQAKKILSTGTSVNLLLQSMPSGKSLLHLDSTVSEDQRMELVPGYRMLEDAFEKTDSELLFKDMFNLTCDDGNNNSNGASGVHVQGASSVHVQGASSVHVQGASGVHVQGASSVQLCSFKELLDKAHLETSLRAKKVLFDDHKLMDHLAGIRSFLLLGQGDFIRHFMERLVRVLNRPASLIKTHSLTEILSASIHATNAKFLDEEVLKRIDSIFLDTSQVGSTSGQVEKDRFLLDVNQTTGWDIFTLTYRTKGPISTILTNSCMQKYSILFKHLWRSKRMEIILTELWMRYRSTSPRLKLFPDDVSLRNRLKTMYHQNSLLIHEMNHFIQQMSYYIGFEVVECSWEEFIQRLNASSDIDSLVEAHNWFLTNVSIMSMLEPPSNPLFLQLRAVYDCITDYQTELRSFEEKLSSEVKSREEYKKKGQGSSCVDTTDREGAQEAGEGRTVPPEDEERKELKRREKFESKVVETFKVQMYIKSAQYQEMVQSFLILLAEHPDVNMKLLSTRIDFNKYYAKSNKSLETSFHFSQRLSLDGSFK